MLAAISLVTAGVFVLDAAIPLGHGMWLLYLFPLWLSSRRSYLPEDCGWRLPVSM